MSTPSKTFHQSVILPAKLTAHVRILAKARGVSLNRMLVELIEKGIEVEKRKQRQGFFKLAKSLRNARDPVESRRLGDKLGRMVFGD